MEGSSQAHEVSPLRSDLQAKGLSQRLKGLSRSSGTDWQRAGVPGETVVDIIVKGLVVDQGLDRLALTASGRAVLKAIAMALLSDLQKSENAKYINWGKVDEFRKFGGIRIEDDVVVTTSGHENLTRAAFSET